MRFTPRIGLIATGLAIGAVLAPGAQASFRPTYVHETYLAPVPKTDVGPIGQHPRGPSRF